MAEIHVLDKQVAELIAAGEVVERPSSVVKELVENAIDAGASAITVEIRRGGISYIRVTDNGKGIAPEDLPVAFLRHATSKVRLSDDLNAIATLGFRGEALASVASVAQVEMQSKKRDQILGARIVIEGGEQKLLEETGCADGTTIFVRELFYNVPARLKFLKKDTTEASVINGIMDRIALSHPEISFKYISDRKTRLHTPGDGNLLSAIHAVFGRDFADGMIAVDYGFEGVSVKGYICSTRNCRPSRSMQHFFVNNRYIHSKLCAVALEEGYQGSMMVGKYPSCVLNISVPFDLVDVNVHPAKTEVRFVNERAVYDTVLFAVRSAIGREDILKRAAAATEKKPMTAQHMTAPFHAEESEQTVMKVPAKAQTEEKPAALPVKPAVKENDATPIPVTTRTVRNVASRNAEYSYGLPPVNEKKKEEPAFSYLKPANWEKKKPIEAAAPEKKITFIPEEPDEPKVALPAKTKEPVVEEKTAVKEKDFTESFRMIGELFATYVLFEGGDRFFLLDKHAAHERILYEKLKKSVKTDERQMLLSPIVVNISAEEQAVLSEHTKTMEELGFAYESFGERSVLIREVPLVLANADQKALFLDLVGKLCDNRKNVSGAVFEELLHSMACRAAIKANDTTSVPELEALLRMVIENDEIRHCPHGRPVVIAFTKAELERRFGRIT